MQYTQAPPLFPQAKSLGEHEWRTQQLGVLGTHHFESDTEISDIDDDDHDTIFSSMDLLSPGGHSDAQTLAMMLQEQLDAINKEIRSVSAGADPDSKLTSTLQIHLLAVIMKDLSPSSTLLETPKEPTFKVLNPFFSDKDMAQLASHYDVCFSETDARLNVYAAVCCKLPFYRHIKNSRSIRPLSQNAADNSRFTVAK